MVHAIGRAAFATALLLTAAAAAPAAEPRPLLLERALAAMPKPELALPAGEHAYPAGPALLFVPERTGPELRPIPLLVALPGYQQSYRRFGRALAKQALPRGVAVLAINYRKDSWDALTEPAARGDLEHADRVLAWALERLNADRDRVVLVGVSDGATYALPLGISNPQLFRKLVAIVPGGVGAPVAHWHASPEVLLLAASNDEAFPAPLFAERIRTYLEGQKISVEYRVFKGGHGFPRREIPAILDWLFGAAAEVSAPK